MPKEMEKKLKATAKKRGYSKERAGAYVYGTMRKTGWRPSKERKTAYKKLKNEGKGGPAEYKAGLSGRKIRSKGKGRGLGTGKGRGPVGRQA